ncbi:hypothetical protein FOA52_006750 [Chlamydomonas sp. UWO 241]|nr:hypothetical protein FOA52_006750 [Chlamydomonas sp. UWO 241]
MCHDLDLSSEPGIVVRQFTQASDAAAQVTGCCYQPQLQYKVSRIPAGKRAATDQEYGTPGRFAPSAEELAALPQMFHVQEESVVWVRMLLALCGGLNLRPMHMHWCMHPTRAGTSDAYTVERPCRCGGHLCCPLEMSVYARHRPEAQQLVGRVEEDFSPYPMRCTQQACLCTTYHKVLAMDADRFALTHKYSLRTGMACCGRVNNCCGSTCFRHDLISDILDSNGKVVAHVQRTYAPSAGPGCLGACCRCAFEFSNFVMQFPEDATEDDRALLLAALFNLELQMWERRGGEHS